MAQGKLFVIDSGTDGSGKKTQVAKLAERLQREGYPVRVVDYPNYESPSSALVKMYLNGEFGANPEDVNPYTASTFYAVDRCASFLKDWKNFYENGGIILADRYTTSNMVHQASKFQEPEQLAFVDWLIDLEYTKCGLPAPDQVFLLDVPVEVATALIVNRPNKFTHAEKKDIHESNTAYLQKCYATSKRIAKALDWQVIPCTENGEMKSIEAIHELIYAHIITNI